MRIGIFLSDHKRDYRPTAGEEERPLIARLTLHAEKLAFVHPDGRNVTIECRLPKDFRGDYAAFEAVIASARGIVVRRWRSV